MDFIQSYVKRNGYEPSYQLIARQLGVSAKSGIARHIQALEAQGFLARRRRDGKYSLDLLSTRTSIDELVSLEFVVDLGRLGLNESSLQLPQFLVGMQPQTAVFVYKAPNDSMIERHILEGDLLLAERRDFARRGEIVIGVDHAGEPLFGNFIPAGVECHIVPSNDQFETHTLASDEIEIKGVVKGLIRPFQFTAD